jgi:predicted acylesterase/phospholipase RssA
MSTKRAGQRSEATPEARAEARNLVAEPRIGIYEGRRRLALERWLSEPPAPSHSSLQNTLNAVFKEPWRTLEEPPPRVSFLCRVTSVVWDIFVALSAGVIWIADAILLRVLLGARLVSSTSTAAQAALRRRQTRLERQRLLERLGQADSYSSYYETAAQLDWLEGRSRWKTSLTDAFQLYDRKGLMRQLSQLSALYRQGDIQRLMFNLRGCLTRDFCGIHRAELHRRCRVGTKREVEDFVYVVSWLLEYIATTEDPTVSWRERLEFFNQVRHAYGKSALLLSGGSTMGLSHFGVLKALQELRLLPRILSGASAGALVVAFAGVFSDEELIECLESFRNPWTGRPLRFEIFDPSLSWYRAMRRFAKRGVLFDIRRLQGCMRENLGDLTFQEAYNRTKRIINMTVTPAYGPPVLLNYLTAPNVLVWSAACASAALPLIFAPVELFAKDERGSIIPYHPEGFQWSDGSISADIPLQRIGEMFNVNHFIVSQANPHFIPRGSMLMKARLMQAIKAELKFRYSQLEGLGLVPRIFRMTISILTQPFEGDVTVLRDLSLADLRKLFRNPTLQDIRAAVARGQRLAYTKLDEIHHNCLIEFTIDDCIEYIGRRFQDAATAVVTPRSSAETSSTSRLFPRVPSWLWADFGSFGGGSASRSPPASPKTRGERRVHRISLGHGQRHATDATLETIPDTEAGEESACDESFHVRRASPDIRALHWKPASSSMTCRSPPRRSHSAEVLHKSDEYLRISDSLDKRQPHGEERSEFPSSEQSPSDSADEDERVMC